VTVEKHSIICIQEKNIFIDLKIDDGVVFTKTMPARKT